jgi:D-alanyl-D-alanine carboxypeptidase/D-alanyl-D-alanine-endopeptidase (penicillin-binding protein 4)
VLASLAPTAASAATPPRSTGAGGPLVPTTPILSVRRLPVWLADTVALQKLNSGLSADLAAAGPAGSVQACLLVDRGGATVVADNPTTALIPASNLKILTAAAALDRLGANDRLTTVVRAAGSWTGGVLSGDLYLVGGGDPVLRTAPSVASLPVAEPAYTSLPALASEVRAAGITTVTGSVVGDESRYDTEREVSSWKPTYLTEGDVGPLSALTVNDGFDPLVPRRTAAAQPAASAAAQFAALLRADGVTVVGPATVGRTPPTATRVASVSSPPMAELVDGMLQSSDDTAAELLTKEMGRQRSGYGSTATGVAAITATLAAEGLPVDQLAMADGSGLSRDDRASCAVLVAELERAGTTGTLASGLPVAATSGTLSDRLKATPAAGRVHAKTGTLDGVASLSGFVTTPAGPPPTPELAGPLTFSLILNGLAPSVDGDQVTDSVAVTLARFPAVPALSAISPEPPSSPAAGEGVG